MARYTFNLEGLEEEIVLKLVEHKILGSTMHSTLETIVRDWVQSNQTKLMEWDINPIQIAKKLLDNKKMKKKENKKRV